MLVLAYIFSMLGRLLPKQKDFFTLFRQATDTIIKAAGEFRLLIGDLPNAAEHAQIINAYERQGDDIALRTYKLLHRTFITPFDRHDINVLTTQLDDILDRINRLSQRIVIYQLTSMPAEILHLTDLCHKITVQVRAVIDKLDTLKNQAAILQICLDIDQLENDAEVVLLNGISKLFQEEKNLKHLIKLKEVYEKIKVIINACQDTANLVKSIVLEYA